jgi:hypothetical protein
VLLKSDLRKKKAPSFIARMSLLAVVVPEGAEYPWLFSPEVPAHPEVLPCSATVIGAEVPVPQKFGAGWS